ncbi:3'-5' exoribonuclease YhaM family protein [Rubrobacter indicoceani]|uniref:3'-5' exoribonuclease YhaM family protein n=1 Tax=Rubrobacter indicoceani TaxID=2051957 RepID=UPI000E5AC02E|nr:HD domain-containing protein [Rubrobacter indicoceani]
MSKENFWARDLGAGQRVRSTFLARDASVRNDSRGVPYLSTMLLDKTGSIDARMWGLPQELLGGIPEPGYVHVEGQTHEYRGMLQLKVERLRVLRADEVSEEDYLPVSEQDRRAMAAEVLEAGWSFRDDNLAELFGLIASDKDLWDAFCEAPAAKTMHHARLGGLLEHSLQCMRVAKSLAKLYPVNRDLLVFCAIFHDVGKVRELSWDLGGFAYTTEGRLIGHVVLGERVISDYIEQLPDFPKELALHISHILLAHQGEQQFGSPEIPKTLEAILVHFIDNMDARLGMYAESTKNVTDGGWSHHDNPLRRALYVPENPESRWNSPSEAT